MLLFCVFCSLLQPAAHCHIKCLNLDAPLTYSQECAAEKTREPSVKPPSSCNSIASDFHGLSHSFNIIFLHYKNTKWNVTAMNNYCLSNPISFKVVVPSSDFALLGPSFVDSPCVSARTVSSCVLILSILVRAPKTTKVASQCVPFGAAWSFIMIVSTAQKNRTECVTS